MLNYIVHRILLMIPTLLGVALLIFFMLRVLPGEEFVPAGFQAMDPAHQVDALAAAALRRSRELRRQAAPAATAAHRRHENAPGAGRNTQQVLVP